MLAAELPLHNIFQRHGNPMANIVPVILCGGSGSRLWPLSRANHPKQFVDLGGGRTLFGDTVARLQKLGAAPVCVCNERHRFHVIGTLPQGSLLILEPQARDTAPAIALAAMASQERHPGALMLIAPADHYFAQEEAFLEAVRESAPVAESGHIVTFGIEPSRAAPGFGYIRAGKEVGCGCSVVDAFVEKPGAEQAQEMLASGKYYWNAGIFMTSPETILTELATCAPEIAAQSRAAYKAMRRDGDIWRPGREEFEASPALSIDYAVMERCRRAAVRPVTCGWSDMGSWEAMYNASQKDEQANASSGRVILEKTSGCHIHAAHRLVAAAGLHDITIVETPDAVLVTPRNQDQHIRAVVKRLKEAGAPECEQHRLVRRPWGSYEILASGDRFQVKRIIVRPGEGLSLQIHHHRAEHWIVVSGTAEVTRAGETAIYTENQSTYIPVGCPHRLCNPGLIPLMMIEIQSGSYLGEDDIVRLEDNYRRQGNE